MVGIVVGRQQRFAQDRLAVPVRDLRRDRWSGRRPDRTSPSGPCERRARSCPMPSRPAARAWRASSRRASRAIWCLGSRENSRMSHCAMRRCSSTSHGECSAPLGRLPRRAGGRLRTAASKSAWAWPPVSRLTRCWRRDASRSAVLAFFGMKTFLRARSSSDCPMQQIRQPSGDAAICGSACEPKAAALGFCSLSRWLLRPAPAPPAARRRSPSGPPPPDRSARSAAARERTLLRRGLGLHQAAIGGHHHVHVHLGLRVLLVAEVEQRRAAHDAH